MVQLIIGQFFLIKGDHHEEMNDLFDTTCCTVCFLFLFFSLFFQNNTKIIIPFDMNKN